VPSFWRRESVIDADPVEPATKGQDVVADPEQARSLAEEAEAEAAEADAIAAAARARARAIRLRRQAGVADTGLVEGAPTVVPETPSTAVELDTGSTETDEVAPRSAVGSDLDADEAPAADTEDADTVDADTVDADTDDADTDDAEVATVKAPSRWRIRRPSRPSWKRVVLALVATLAVLGTVALLSTSGFMIIKHREVQKLQQQNAEYVAAGRQSVVTLMSLDFTKAKDDIQRIIDNSTGQFKSDFQQQAADFIKVAQDSKVITEVTVNSVAVESMTDTSAVVLVAASSRVTNTSGAKQEPRTWRLSVNLERDGDQIKMSKVEFVP
jgi:Mce-associated membrane protein